MVGSMRYPRGDTIIFVYIVTFHEKERDDCVETYKHD